jgi:hypothetical protein
MIKSILCPRNRVRYNVVLSSCRRSFCRGHGYMASRISASDLGHGTSFLATASARLSSF